MDYLWNNIWAILLIVNYLVVLITAIFIIGHNRNPVSTLSYILSMVVFPFVGILVYFFFGQEYRKEKMFQRKGIFDDKKVKEWEKKLLLSEEKLERYESSFLDDKVKLVRLLQNNQKKPLTFKNETRLLINGEQKFEALFADLQNARHHIHVEYYIFNSDNIGTKFIELLCEKVKEGVEVRVIYDYVASANGLSDAAIKKMKTCGIEIFPFMPVRFPNLTRRLNYRDHRKIVVIDGKIGYLGGVNVCDEYVNPTQNGKYWRDTHLRLKGNAVKSLQSHFLLNWNFVSESEIKIIDEYFPNIDVPPGKAVQIAASGPDSDWPNIMESILLAINGAEEYVYITTPYFIPNDQILTALKTVSRSGVRVKLLIPKEGDSWITQYAADSYVQELLESDIEVFRYCKGMVHAKTMAIDGSLSTVGSCNMDYRSFEINFEINALIYNKEFTEKMTDVFENDIKECEQIHLKEWEKRTLRKKWTESFCRLWAPLL